MWVHILFEDVIDVRGSFILSKVLVESPGKIERKTPGLGSTYWYPDWPIRLAHVLIISKLIPHLH